MPNWIPLEANPDVFNEYARKLGMSKNFTFTDVFGFDAELLSFIPQPVKAVILLFPITSAYESFRKCEAEEIRLKPQVVSKEIWFTKQTIGNACGTIGLLHAILNGLDESDIDNGNRPLLKIFNKTRHFSADERAKFLESEEASELANLHFHSSIEGQSTVPESNADVDLHFVTFVEVEGQLYELDGRKPFPINHGACINLLEDSVNGI